MRSSVIATWKFRIAPVRSLADGAVFNDDQIRAEDSCPGTLEVLPGWDSVGLVEWLTVFEELLGEPVPNNAIASVGTTFSVADLVRSAQGRRRVGWRECSASQKHSTMPPRCLPMVDAGTKERVKWGIDGEIPCVPELVPLTTADV